MFILPTFPPLLVAHTMNECDERFELLLPQEEERENGKSTRKFEINSTTKPSSNFPHFLARSSLFFTSSCGWLTLIFYHLAPPSFSILLRRAATTRRRKWKLFFYQLIRRDRYCCVLPPLALSEKKFIHASVGSGGVFSLS